LTDLLLPCWSIWCESLFILIVYYEFISFHHQFWCMLTTITPMECLNLFFSLAFTYIGGPKGRHSTFPSQNLENIIYFGELHNFFNLFCNEPIKMIHCKNKIELGKHPNHLINLKIKIYYFHIFCGMCKVSLQEFTAFFYYKN